MAKTLARVVRELLDDPHLSKKTKKTYESILIRFMSERGYVAIKSISREEIENYLQSLSDLSLKTHHLHQTVIHRLFNLALEKRYLNSNPVSHIRRRKPDPEKGEHRRDSVIRYLTKEQLEKLFWATRKEMRLNPLVCLLYESGARISEVLALNLDQIDFTNCKFEVIGKGNKKRLCYFGDRTQKALSNYINDYRESPHEALFTERRYHYGDVRRLVYSSAQREFRAVVDGYKLLKGIRFHDLRHTFATERANLIPLEVLRALMGHESIQTTMIYQRITSQVAEKVAKEALQVINDR